MRSRTFIALVSVALVLTGSARSQAPASRRATPPRPPTFFITGHGWGHGIGLSQYGALGYAQHGFKYDKIVAHYFPGTTLGQAPLGKVRVLLEGGASRVTVSDDTSFLVKDGAGKTHKLAGGSYSFGSGFKLKLAPRKPAQALPPPLVFQPGGNALSLDGDPYRGALQVARAGGGLQVVNVVGLDLYVMGVVPREMPKDWPLEALKAQAVVARSYALAHLKHGGSFDLYPDTRSQVYGGIHAESPSSNLAVGGTAGRVVLYQGKVADTMFFSTSGGRTAAVQDVWPAGRPVPYLVSVPDPYDSVSPYHNWGPYRVSPARLARKLGLHGQLLDVQTAINGSLRVKTLTATGSRGQVTLTGQDARQVLGLRSSWFRIEMINLAAQSAPVAFGAQARLTGIARGVSALSLQQRPYGGTWHTVTALKPGADGTLAFPVRPKVSSDYRLVADTVQGRSVHVSVAPLVRLSPVTDRTSLHGRVRPILAGATVLVQRMGATDWTTVTRTTVAPTGDFAAALKLVPGTYRARVLPTRGYAFGTSPILKVLPA
jgi:stage II sporulation protein D